MIYRNLQEALDYARVYGKQTLACTTMKQFEATYVLPMKGKVIGYKKAHYGSRHTSISDQVIVVLEIPARARRVQPKGWKCRASSAKVLEIRNLEGKKLRGFAHSSWQWGFRYKIGELVKPQKPFAPASAGVCASGIHFFMTEHQARDYVI